MFVKYLSRDEPLLPPDVNICQAAFDAICDTQSIDRDSDIARNLASLIIELYKQGVHDAGALTSMIGVAGEP